MRGRPTTTLLRATTITRPGDRYVYLIDEPSAHCASDQRCAARSESLAERRRVARPRYDDGESRCGVPFRRDGLPLSTISRNTQKDGPAALCRPSELFSDAFKSGETTSYFRDPGDRVCEWKESVTIDAKTGSALVPAIFPPANTGLVPWGTTGLAIRSFFPAPRPSLFIIRPLPAILAVALCPKDQSECTEFRDPADTSDLNYPQRKPPYFFINNQKVDKTTCAKFDPYGLGCVLIRDQSSGNLAYSAKATNRAYLRPWPRLVSLIDCNPAAGRCGIP